MELSDSISTVPRVGEAYRIKLKRLGISTIKDLLWYFPKNYQDLSNIKTIREINIEEINTVKGIIKKITHSPARFSKIDITKAILADETGMIEIVWFNQKFLKDILKEGMEILVSGKVQYKQGKFMFTSPSYEFVKEKQIHTGRIIPIYRETEGLTSKWLRSITEPLINLNFKIKDYFSQELIDRNDLMSLSQAISEIHFPKSMESFANAKRRLGFDELFFLQLKAMISRIEWQKKNIRAENLIKIPFEEQKIKDFLKLLPFELTKDQKICTYQILKDFEKGYPMLRLLEGDVGSGKTIVATIGLYMAGISGYQGVLMAPTEVLAKQHFKTVASLLIKFGLNVQLLVGSTKESEKKVVKNGLKNGTIDIAIGTHALIQEDVDFKRLGFAVIDEQHRFGVEQRTILKEKGNPHLLNMTATPIPRTLALTLYGDQDLSIIQEMPKGRKTIITRVIPPKYRRQAELFIEDQVKKGQQVFVICPLIEDSDFLEVKSVTTEFERLQTEVFKDLRISLLHGKMTPKEKDEVMEKFKNREFDILVSTSVIEVGIDIPNATVIVIEGAERFGLAQLHQFRGRVGRGEHQSYCLLFTNDLNQTNRARMKAMVDFDSGFKLAEIDLKLRGPGEVFGTRQSGIPDLRMASLDDRVLISQTREEVEKYLEEDPELKKNSPIKEALDDFLSKVYAG